jgi:hypothetical protein
VLESQFYQAYRKQGDVFTVLQLIGEDLDSQPPSTETLHEWVDFMGLTFPVLADPYWQVGASVAIAAENYYIPFYWLVDQRRVIMQTGNYLDPFHATIEGLLD